MLKFSIQSWKKLPFIFRVSLHVIACVFTIAMLMVITNWKSAEIVFSEISYNGDTFVPIELPHSKNYIGEYWVKVKIQSAVNSTVVRIYPDDEIFDLIVNNKKISLDGFSSAQRRSYSGGFSVPIELQPNAENTLLMKLRNENNPSGFNIVFESSISWQQGVAFWFLFIFYILFLSLSLPVSRRQYFILCAGICTCIVYLSVTGERERIFDVYEGGGHKDYVEYIAHNWSLPDPGQGWEYHQPPLYYGVAATIRTAFVASPNTSDLWARVLALWFWVVFLQASLAVLNVGFRSNNLALLCSSTLFCFWPAGIIHSVRIGNDLPVYMFCGLAFYFIVRWWNSRDIRFVWWASFWIFASLLTKSNGLILSAVLCGLIFSASFSRAIVRRKLSIFWLVAWRPMSIILGFTLLGMALNLGDNIYKYMIGESEDWLLSNVSTTINAGLKVHNGILNYVIFDFSTFIQSPFVSTWDDQYGRQYFWNFLLRSALTSEYFFSGVYLVAWGVLNGIFLMIMLASLNFVLLKKIEGFNSDFRCLIYKRLPWIFLLIASLVFLLAYRIKVPLSCNTDFRYIYMALTPFVFFAASCLRNGFIGRFGVMVPAGLISLGSVVWLLLLMSDGVK